MACEAQRATLTSLQNRLAIIEKNINDTPPPERAAAQEAAETEIKQLITQIQAATAALNKCLAASQPPAPTRVPGAQPKSILQINYHNPNFGGNGTGNDWAGPIAGGTFPEHQGFEWKQVMDTTNEYDATPAGASGWVAYPADIAGEDFMFLHPFGNDWEFSCVLDQQYLPLVSQGNINATGGTQLANDLTALGIPSDDIQHAVQLGLLQIECDSKLVPQSFQDQFHQGDRIGMLGRWIVDCGHSDFHTEFHPPLLLASAAVYETNGKDQFTRALFTSRPYLVGQTFFNGTYSDDVYKDGAGDDGHFLEHMVKEVLKAENPLPIDSSLKVEAHPKIKQFPFQGPHLFQVIVAPSQPKPPLLPVTNAVQLIVSFHFTVRSGCAVQVGRNDDSSVSVFFAMNSVGYTPPPLPARTAKNYSLTEINTALNLSFGIDLLVGLGGILGTAISPKGTLVLARGVETDEYAATPDVNFSLSGSPAAVINTPITQLQANKGITIDNSQPYPITGWIEVKWGEAAVSVDQGNPTAGLIKTIFDLNGKWSGGPVISVSGNAITVDMTALKRPTAHGSVTDASDITVTFPDDKTYTGKLQGPNKIIWSNNTTWTKA